MSDELNKINEIASAFEEFKSANDKRIAEIEAKGSSDVVTNEKVETITTALAEVQDELKSIAKKAGRIGGEVSVQDEYSVKFNEWARYGEGERELKSMTASGGDVYVPAVVDTNIISKLKATSAMRSLAKVVSVSTPDYSFLRNDSATASGWVSETDARPETASPKLTKVSVPFGIIYANPAASQVVLEDSAHDLEEFLADEMAKDFAEEEGAAFINGVGGDRPLGILANGTGIEAIETEVVSVISADDILNLVYGLKSGHRAGASFIMNSATMAAVRKLKGDDGQYIWQPSLIQGQPATLCGYPVYEDENMPDVADGAKAIAFGNWQRGYIIADRVGIAVLRDPYTSKPHVHFYATKRTGGRPTDVTAIKLLVVKAA